MKTHLPGEPGKTLCGKTRFCHKRPWFGDTVTRGRETPLQLIGKNDLVDSATCKACQRADDAQQVRQYRRECAAAGLDPATGRKP